LLVAGAVIVFMRIRSAEKVNNRFDRKDLYGEIISYEETEEGTVFVLDVRGYISPRNCRNFLPDEETLYADAEIEQIIADQETGRLVYVYSEYWSADRGDVVDGIYPVTYIELDVRE